MTFWDTYPAVEMCGCAIVIHASGMTQMYCEKHGKERLKLEEEMKLEDLARVTALNKLLEELDGFLEIQTLYAIDGGSDGISLERIRIRHDDLNGDIWAAHNAIRSALQGLRFAVVKRLKALGVEE